MTIQITGKNLDLGETLRDYALGRIEQAVDKYFNIPASGQMSVEKAHGQFTASCSLHLHSGFDVQTSGRAADAYASVDEAAAKLEKQLRRYKRRLKNHHGTHSQRAADELGMYYVLEAPREADGEEEEAPELAPPIIAERQTAMLKLSVSDAVMHMDLSDRPFLIFRNANHDGLNVVYRRDDGNIGWIDPAGSLKKD